jgi:hypothetical protein
MVDESRNLRGSRAVFLSMSATRPFGGEIVEQKIIHSPGTQGTKAVAAMASMVKSPRSRMESMAALSCIQSVCQWSG